MTNNSERLCDCGCGTSFRLPAQAPHKRFASASHKDRFWSRQREEAARQWRQLTAVDEAEGEAPAKTMEHEP